jgi:hypothetical protein
MRDAGQNFVSVRSQMLNENANPTNGENSTLHGFKKTDQLARSAGGVKSGPGGNAS